VENVGCTEEQILAIPREADRTPLTEVVRKHKIGEQAEYVCRGFN
jgi:hypothetical protein